jgi:hypothetical protein
MTNVGRVKIGNHMLRSRRIVRPFPIDAVKAVDLFFRQRDWRFIGSLPANLWCDLIDGLSRCDCGRPVPPIRARQKRILTSQTCSTTCARRRTLREHRAAERAGTAPAKTRDVVHALADALYQSAGGNE